MTTYNLPRRIQNPVKHLRWNFTQKIVSSFQSLTISVKNSVLDVSQGFEYASYRDRKHLLTVDTKDKANYTKHVRDNNDIKTTCQWPKDCSS